MNAAMGERAPQPTSRPTTLDGALDEACLTGSRLSGGGSNPHVPAARHCTTMAACRLHAARRGLADGEAELNIALTQLSTSPMAADPHAAGSKAPMPAPVFETAQIVSQMISRVFSNVMLSIETQEVAAGVGKMRVGDGGRRQPRYQPYSKTPPKASYPRASTNGKSGHT